MDFVKRPANKKSSDGQIKKEIEETSEAVVKDDDDENEFAEVEIQFEGDDMTDN